MSGIEKVHAKLRQIRERDDLKLRPTKHLKGTFTDFDGSEKPLKVRYYQVQGILHLVAMKRFLLGDDTGLGKTLEAIAALCYIWESAPDTKAIILTTKSATTQWANEFIKFTTGIKGIIAKGTPKQREKARKAFERSTGPTVLIMGYATARQDFTHLQGWKDYILICDEATAFKTPTTQIHKVCRFLSEQASRCWALTATLIKNHLIEGYGIYQVVVPGLFGMTRNRFMLYYCIVKMQRIPRSNRQIPVIIGYEPSKILEFKEEIDPYYLGRPKHVVASELPSLTTRIVEAGMSQAQLEYYLDALDGFLDVGIKDDDGDDLVETREVTKLTAITYCQEIVDHLELIGQEGGSEKLDMLIDLLTQGDLANEKVIIFSRFRRMVDILMPVLKKAKIGAVRITGNENEDQRKAAQDAFQNPNSDTRAVCITTAGSEAINLQAAHAIIFFDTPWSGGDYIQTLGRMIRIGSIHDRCYAVHLVARGKGKVTKTVDGRVLDVLKAKMRLIERVLGKRIKGEDGDDDADFTIPVQNDLNALFDGLREDARAK